MTPRIIGKIARMVSETSWTESSIPPICAKLCVIESKSAVKMKIDLFITMRFINLKQVGYWNFAKSIMKRSEEKKIIKL